MEEQDQILPSGDTLEQQTSFLLSALELDVSEFTPIVSSLITDSSALLGDFWGRLFNYFQVSNENLNELRNENGRLSSLVKEMSGRINELQESNASAASQSTQHANILVPPSPTSACQAKERSLEVEKILNDVRVLKKSLESVEGQNRELLLLIERKNSDIDSLNEQINQVNSKLKESKNESLELEKRLAEAQGKESIGMINKLTLEKELENARSQSEWLNNELNTKISEFQAFRREKSMELSEAVSRLQERETRNEFLERQVSELQNTLEKTNSALEEAKRAEKDTKQTLYEKEENFKLEISAQKRLIELQEENLKEHAKYIQNYEETVQELQASLAERNEQVKIKDAAIREFNENVQSTPMRSTPKKSHLATPSTRASGMIESTPAPLVLLEEEENESALSLLSPSADVARRLQKSGKSVTEVYAEYSKIKNELAKITFEKNHLSEVMEGMVKEIESAAKKMDLEKQTLESIKRENKTMASELGKVSSERNAFKQRLEQLDGEMARLRNENKYLTKGNSDLARQIQELLRKIEIQRGNSDALSSFNSFEVMSSSDQLISERLVTYGNVEELVTRNMELLKVVRVLSDEKEARERELSNGVNSQALKSLEQYEKELDELKKQRVRQQNMLEGLIRQRDMYKEMAAKNGGANAIEKDDDSVTEFSPEKENSKLHNISDNRANEYYRKYEELLKEFETYKKEKADIDRQLSVDLETLRHESSSIRIKLSKAESELKFEQERYQVLQKNYESQRKDLDNCRSNNNQMMGSLLEHQKQLERKVQDLLCEKEKALSLTVQLTSIKSQCETLQQTNARIMHENSTVQQDKKRAEDLMINLQKMQNEFELTQSESRRRLQTQIESNEEEIKSLKLKLNEERDNLKVFNIRHENEVNSLRDRIERLTQDLHSSREELLAQNLKLEESVKANKEISEKLKSSENRLNAILAQEALESSTGLSHEKQLELDLRETRSELLAVKEELSHANEDVQQYKAISAASEEALSELSGTFDSYKIAKDGELENLRAENRQQMTRLNENTEELEKLQSELQKVLSDQETNRQLWEQEKLSLTERIESLSKVEESFAEKESKLKEICQEQIKLAQEAQTNYEREILLHATDLRNMTDAKTQLTQIQEAYNELQLEFRNAKQSLESAQEDWTRVRVGLENDRSELETKVEDLRRQNEILLSQLENSITTQQSSGSSKQLIENSNFEETSSNADSSSNPLWQKYHELVEVVRFVRREKDILQCQFDLVDHECKKFKSQAEHLQSSLDACQKSLKEEQGKSHQILEKEASFKDLLEKVNQLNILRESNSTLRRESESTLQRLKLMEKSYEEERQKLGPLEESKRSLEAELSSMRETVKLLQADNNRWKERVDKLLAKYDRIDPVEYKKALEERDEALKTIQEEKSSRESEATRLKSHITAYKNKAEELVKKLKETAIEKRKMEASIHELQSKTSSNAEDMESEKTALQEQLEKLTSELNSREEEIKTLKAEVETANTKHNSILNVSKRIRQINEALKKQIKEKDGLMLKEKEAHEESLKNLMEEIKELKNQVTLSLSQVENTVNVISIEQDQAHQQQQQQQKSQLKRSRESSIVSNRSGSSSPNAKSPVEQVSPHSPSKRIKVLQPSLATTTEEPVEESIVSEEVSTLSPPAQVDENQAKETEPIQEEESEMTVDQETTSAVEAESENRQQEEEEAANEEQEDNENETSEDDAEEDSDDEYKDEVSNADERESDIKEEEAEEEAAQEEVNEVPDAQEEQETEVQESNETFAAEEQAEEDQVVTIVDDENTNEEETKVVEDIEAKNDEMKTDETKAELEEIKAEEESKAEEEESKAEEIKDDTPEEEPEEEKEEKSTTLKIGGGKKKITPTASPVVVKTPIKKPKFTPIEPPSPVIPSTSSPSAKATVSKRRGQAIAGNNSGLNLSNASASRVIARGGISLRRGGTFQRGSGRGRRTGNNNNNNPSSSNEAGGSGQSSEK